MKKIFSLLMVVAIVLTMSVAAMAADPVKGMHTIITETDDDITVTVKIGDFTSCNGITSYLKTTAVTYVADSATMGAEFTAAGATITETIKDGYIKFVLSITDASKVLTLDGEIVALTYKVTKVKDGELATSDFAYGTGILDVSKVNTLTGGTVADVSAVNNFTSKKQPTYFTVEYVDDRTKDDPDPVEWDGFTDAETADWDSKFAYKAEDGGEDITTGYTGKKVVAFGKNASGATLTAGSYGIKIGKNAYAGMLPVDAGKVFAIILIDSNNDTKVGDTSYFYSIWNGTEDTIVKSGLQATID